MESDGGWTRSALQTLLIQMSPESQRPQESRWHLPLVPQAQISHVLSRSAFHVVVWEAWLLLSGGWGVGVVPHLGGRSKNPRSSSPIALKEAHTAHAQGERLSLRNESKPSQNYPFQPLLTPEGRLRGCKAADRRYQTHLHIIACLQRT